jgi:positive regulator of sigma E activity
MEEKGKVIKVSGGKATVRFERKAQCSKCGMCAFSPKSPYFDMELENSLGAGEGDTVTVSMPAGSVLLSSALVYLLPLLFTAAGLAVGFFAGGQNLAALLGLAMLAAGFAALSLIDRILKKGGNIPIPKIVSVEKANPPKKTKTAP